MGAAARWLALVGVYLAAVLTLSIATFDAGSLAALAVPHFVPTDASYGSAWQTATIADERMRIAPLVAATAVTLLFGWLLLGMRNSVAFQGRVRLAPAAIAATLSALALVFLSSLAAGDFAGRCLWFGLTNIVAYVVVRRVDPGTLRSVRFTGGAIVVFVLFAAGLAAYDTSTPDAAARARDRDKSLAVRYAGAHYARYPGSPWTAKPPQTTDAEMQPLHLRYRQVDRDHYRICTVFETAISTDRRFPHGRGATCYRMTFDDSY